jgi:hypothetical protein
MANRQIFLRAVQSLALLLVLCLCPLCFGESVVVQVLHGRDGTPVPDQLVTMQLRFANATSVMALNSRTDSNGEAHFRLPPATPETLEVEVNFAPNALHCSCRVLANTETVMREGLIVAGRTRGYKLSSPIQATPGHIVFVARPAVLLEKVLFGE